MSYPVFRCHTIVQQCAICLRARANPLQEPIRGEGRIALASWNFGASPLRVGDLMLRNLTGMPTTIQCGQEVTDKVHEAVCAGGWVASSQRLALRDMQQRNDEGMLQTVRRGPGLATFAKTSCASEIIDIDEYWHAQYKNNYSKFIISGIRFHTPRAGFSTLPLCNAHMHNIAAKGGTSEVGRPLPNGAKPARTHFFNALAESICASGCRVLCGDFNMALFDVQPELAMRGLSLVLVAVHVELRPRKNKRRDVLAPASDAHTLAWGQPGYVEPHWDTCGIWIVGGCLTLKALNLDQHVLAGARHPFELVEVDGTLRSHPAQRGFPVDAFCGKPSEYQVTAAVQRQVHEIKKDMVTEKTADAKYRVPQRDQGCASGPVANSRLSLTYIQDVAAEQSEEEEAAPAARRPVQCPEVPFRAVSTRLQLRPMHFAEEWLAQDIKWDKLGVTWGRDGHWPLFCVIGRDKHYGSAHADDQLVVAWKKNGGITANALGLGGSRLPVRKFTGRLRQRVVDGEGCTGSVPGRSTRPRNWPCTIGRGWRLMDRRPCKRP